MSPRDRSHLVDILQAGERLQEFLEGVDRKTFEDSPLIQSAVVRQIEVMGEATKRLSEEFREKHREIPWRKLAGIRDILIHAYDHVDLDEVWLTARSDIPAILEKIMEII